MSDYIRIHRRAIAWPFAVALRFVVLLVALGLAPESVVRAQVITDIHDFNQYPNGNGPSSLIQGSDGNFYGTMGGGGAFGNYGTVFMMTPAGVLTTLHSFNGSDGSGPSGLILGIDGNFYGVTGGGGANGYGTFFQITPAGILTTLHSFISQDGSGFSNLIQGSDGNFYGTTGSNGGTVFRITPAGVVTTLHSFNGTNGTGDNPLGGLVQGSDGNFYGTTFGGGTANGVNGHVKMSQI